MIRKHRNKQTQKEAARFLGLLDVCTWKKKQRNEELMFGMALKRERKTDGERRGKKEAETWRGREEERSKGRERWRDEEKGKDREKERERDEERDEKRARGEKTGE